MVHFMNFEASPLGVYHLPATHTVDLQHLSRYEANSPVRAPATWCARRPTMAHNEVVDEPPEAFEGGLLVLKLVLKHSRSLAHDLYLVCQDLAAQVVEGCSVVTCHSLGDLAVLLDSPRWTGHKTVTALTVSTVSPTQQPAPLYKPAVHAQVAKARQLCVWVKAFQLVAGRLRGGDDCADLAVLTDLAPKLPDLESFALFPEDISDDDDGDYERLWVQLSKICSTKTFRSSLVSAFQYWPQLQHLRLTHYRMKWEDVQPFFGAAACCQQLQVLDLAESNLGSLDHYDPDFVDGARLNESLESADQPLTGWEQIRYWDKQKRLEELADRRLAPDGMRSLMTAAQHWQQLRHLILTNTRLCAEGVRHLMAAAQHWRQLQILDLSHNCLYEKGARALAAAAPHWPLLQRLSLKGCSLGDDGAQALAAAVQHWPQLYFLDLASNMIGALGAQALLEAAPYMPDLQHLDLAYNAFSEEAGQALAAAAPHCKKLRHLGLRDNYLVYLGDSFVRALAPAGQHWTQLQELGLRGTGFTSQSHVIAIGALEAAVPHWRGCIMFEEADSWI